MADTEAQGAFSIPQPTSIRSTTPFLRSEDVLCMISGLLYLVKRKFWREMLPRLQYRNPGVPMTITRHLDPSLPATLTIFYRQPAATSTTTSPSPPVTPSGPHRVEKAIDIKNLSEAGILQQLLLETKATSCEPTEVELQELRELEEQKERSRRDSERSLEVRRQRKREEAMLKAARGEVLQAT
jgi:large subunit ribosomal protein MRP49